MPEFIAYAVAALALGLWWGERGRRLDAQRREGVLQVDGPRRAKTIPPDSVNRDADEYRAARERFVVETMAEVACSRAEAEAEFDRLYTRAQTDVIGGPIE